MPYTDAEIQEILEAHKEELVSHILTETKEQIVYQVKWNCSKFIQDFVEQFMKDEILPEMKAELLRGKEGLVKMAVDFSEEVSKELTTALVTKIKTNLVTNYKLSEILKKLVE